MGVIQFTFVMMQMVFGKDFSHVTWTSQELELTGQSKTEWKLCDLLHFCSTGSEKSIANPFYKV